MLKKQFHDGKIFMQAGKVGRRVFDGEVEGPAEIFFGAGLVIEFVGVGAGGERCFHGSEFDGDGVARDGFPE